MSFVITSKSKTSRARRGRITTSHGVIETPAFMPVGTQGTIKAGTPGMLEAIGASIMLSNTYHLYLRPGPDLIRELGGLHKFAGWNKPILTDSGGYQVFSLSALRKVSDEGVVFTSHIDGSEHKLTPESVVDTQLAFGSDIMMPLDECVHYPCDYIPAGLAVTRTTEWAARSLKQVNKRKKELGDKAGLLFGIVQGGVHSKLRQQSAEQIVPLGFPGYGIGGLSVGEPREAMWEMLDAQIPILPEEAPRHLMGVGYPEEIRKAVSYGVDLFDCVIPTRLGRHGGFITDEGKMIIKNEKFKKDPGPLMKGCDCPVCGRFSRAFIRHLFIAREISALIFLTVHNLRYYLRTMEQIRAELEAGTFKG